VQGTWLSGAIRSAKKSMELCKEDLLEVPHNPWVSSGTSVAEKVKRGTNKQHMQE